MIKSVREQCVDRDGYCRLALSTGSALSNLKCYGLSEWAHFDDKKRFKTRGMAPEIRHASSGSLMLCTTMHKLYDLGELWIKALTDQGADGPMAFKYGDCEWREG